MHLIFFFLCLYLASFAKALNVEVRAPAAILINADTGVVLFEKHAHIPAYPASTTKIATALYVLDQGMELTQMTTVSREALRAKPTQKNREVAPWWHESDGTMMGLKVGERISLEALLHGLMLISGNDAANVIAEMAAGSVPLFMERLNEYLKEIGCKNTQFRNPHGLTDVNHSSTAYDLALITSRALKFPQFRKIVSTLRYEKGETNKQPKGEIKLTNPLLKPASRHYYAKAIGVKTGYTQAAKNTLVAAAEYEGRTLIAVLLGCETREDRYEDAKRLFDTAFAEVKTTRRLMGAEQVFAKEILGSRKNVKASLITPLSISFFPSEEPECKAALHWKVEEVPIHKGQKVGEIHILSMDDRLLEKGDLFALEEMKGSLLYILKRKIGQLVGLE